jgi:hypothetical protein
LPGKKIGLLVAGLAIVIAAGLLASVVIGTATSQEDPLAHTMPSNVIAYFSMTTRPDRQPHFDAVAAAWRDSKEAEQIESALNSLLTFSDFNWEDDILPWLGDRAALGVVDLGGYDLPPADSSSGGSSYGRYRMPFVVLAAQTRDRAESDALLAAFRRQRESGLPEGSAIFDEVYRDVSIAYVANDAEYLPPYGEAWATIGDVVVAVASGRDDLKKVVDAALDGATLAESENFRATMDALPAQNVASFYVDYARFMDEMMALTSRTHDAFAGFTPDAAGDADTWQKQMEEMRRRQDERRARLQEMLQAFGGMGGAMVYEPGGIRFDWVMQYSLERLPRGVSSGQLIPGVESCLRLDSIVGDLGRQHDESGPPVERAAGRPRLAQPGFRRLRVWRPVRRQSGYRGPNRRAGATHRRRLERRPARSVHGRNGVRDAAQGRSA